MSDFISINTHESECLEVKQRPSDFSYNLIKCNDNGFF